MNDGRKPRLTFLNNVVIVDIFDLPLKMVLRDLSQRLTLYETRKVTPHKVVTLVAGTYCWISKDEKQGRFNIHSSSTVLQAFSKYGIGESNLDIVMDTEYPIAKIKLKVKDEYTPRAYQKRYIWSISGKEAKRSHLVDLQPGYGKALSLDTKLRIPNGWKLMRDVELGDTLIGRDGTPINVNGVYPQGIKEMYKITFEDGRSTECCAEHLWSIYHDDWEYPKVIDTDAISKMLEEDSSKKPYIDLPKPERNEDKEYVVSPYVLGAVLSNSKVVSDGIKILVDKEEVAEKLTEELGIDYLTKQVGKKTTYVIHIKTIVETKYSHGRSIYVEELKRLGIITARHVNKYIPVEYLNGSPSQRTELVKGMLDAGKTSLVDGIIFYPTTNRQLSGDFTLLLRSLGAKVKVVSKEPTGHYDTKNSYNHCISINTPSDYMTGMGVVEDVNFVKNTQLAITSIVQIESKEAQCITVDHLEKLFVVNDYIVTHNSLIGVTSTVKNETRTAVLVKASYVQKWIDDINKYIVLDEDEYYVIKGSASIKTLCDMKYKDVERIKYIVMSIRTMKNYIDNWLEDPKSAPIAPTKFISKFKIGTMLNDESHQEFEALFRIALFLDVKKLIGLSATMVSGNPRQDYMYGLLFPHKDRASELVEYVKYIHMISYTYRLTASNIKHKTYMGYSHIKFEQSLMQRPRALEDYKIMIKFLIDEEYIEFRQTKQKCLVFFSTIAMCSLMTAHIKKAYPRLDVRRYVEDDPYENVLEADIAISTNKSAGTAIDIPKLITAIQTVPISGEQPNIQAAGRLREIDDVKVRYITVHSRNIKSHEKMHYRRLKALKSIVKSTINTTYQEAIGG